MFWYRMRWGLALTGLMFGAMTVASIADRKDLATIAASGITALVLGGLWYFVGWLENR